jgi:DNA-directed RNA polymerase specialized sigma24 family protein
VRPDDQYDQLLDEGRQFILKRCLKKLDEKSRNFITYFLDKPGATTWQASKYFDISKGNVRTKKSRILSRLNDCYQKMVSS